MSGSAQSELRQHVASFYPHAELEGRLLRVYHRRLASRLWCHFTEPGTNEREFFERSPTIWLHPRAVWAARQLTDAPRLFEIISGAVYRDLLRSSTKPPPQEYVNKSREDSWTLAGCRYLQEYDEALGKRYVLSMSPMSVDEIERKVSVGREIVARVWQDAAHEFDQIVRTMVIVQGGGFLYGSFQHMLGSIFIGVRTIENACSVVELLLHEGGHQSLFLHNAFVEYVRNPSEETYHPLRADPRPLAGTLHATHVLGRMVVGFSRWCDEEGSPPEARARLRDLAAHFDAAIGVIRERARWTEAGREYFAALVEGTAEYVRPARRRLTKAGSPAAKTASSVRSES